MLALSPLFSTTYGWPVLENQCTPHNNLQRHISPENEANSYDPFLDFSPQNSVSISSEGAPNDNTCEPMKVAKNLNHNANERDRRKRVNELYAVLGLLLPVSTHQKKKVSIPQTVTRALKYIPELQKEVEALKCKKQKLSSYSSSQDFKKQRTNDAISKKESSVISSVQVLGEKQVVIQLIYPTEDLGKKKKDIGHLSKAMEYIENEDEGFVLLNSTTFIGSGEGMTFNTLHLQARGDKEIEIEKVKTKLCYFHQQ